MGQENLSKMRHFGEFQFDPAVENMVRLPYQVDALFKLSMNLLDQMGRTMLSKNFEVSETGSQLEIQLPDLKNGIYHAWIDVEGETFIRILKINRPSRRSLFDKIKNLFGQSD